MRFCHDNMKVRSGTLNPGLWHLLLTNHRREHVLVRDAAVSNIGAVNQSENSNHFLHRPDVGGFIQMIHFVLFVLVGAMHYIEAPQPLTSATT